MPEQTLLIYDGDCGFCRWSMLLAARADRRGNLRFCPFGHPVAEAYLAELPEDSRYASHHAVVDGVLYSATAAARVTLLALPFGRCAVALGVHRLYPLVARHRALLGRFVPHASVIETCPGPPLHA